MASFCSCCCSANLLASSAGTDILFWCEQCCVWMCGRANVGETAGDGGGDGGGDGDDGGEGGGGEDADGDGGADGVMCMTRGMT